MMTRLKRSSVTLQSRNTFHGRCELNTKRYQLSDFKNHIVSHHFTRMRHIRESKICDHVFHCSILSAYKLPRSGQSDLILCVCLCSVHAAIHLTTSKASSFLERSIRVSKIKIPPPCAIAKEKSKRQAKQVNQKTIADKDALARSKTILASTPRPHQKSIVTSHHSCPYIEPHTALLVSRHTITSSYHHTPAVYHSSFFSGLTISPFVSANLNALLA